MGLRSGSTFSDGHSQTGTCPKAQNQNTEGNALSSVFGLKDLHFLFPKRREVVRKWGEQTLGFP